MNFYRRKGTDRNRHTFKFRDWKTNVQPTLIAKKEVAITTPPAKDQPPVKKATNPAPVHCPKGRVSITVDNTRDNDIICLDDFEVPVRRKLQLVSYDIDDVSDIELE